MAITVILGSASKRPNSTLQFDGGDSYSCTLKEPCGVLSPTIMLAMSGNPSSYNLAHIPAFGRYYFVREWTYSEGLWTASLEVDTLASWKSYIGTQTFYKLRAENDISDQGFDDMLGTLVGNTTSESLFESPYIAANFTAGTYVLGIIGAGGATGAIIYYSMTYAQFAAFIDYLFTNITSLYDIDQNELSEAMQKAFIDPMQYVVSCKWFPFAYTGTSVNSIKLGFWDVPVAAAKLESSAATSTRVTLDIEHHPDIDTYGNTLDFPPFTQRTVYLPPFGTLNLNPRLMVNAESVDLIIITDLIGGMGWCIADYQDGGMEPLASSNVGVDISVASIQSNILQAASNAISGVTKLFSWGGGGEHQLFNAMLDLLPKAELKGSTGGMGIYNQYPFYSYVFQNVTRPPNSEVGGVCMADGVLTAGYNKVSHGDINAPATKSELDAIQNYLESGMFYE